MTDMHDDAPSMEYLNAFVDNELAPPDRETALARLESDPAFKARVCELRTLKERVKGAYTEASAPARRDGLCPGGWRQALVAGLMLVLGWGGGWFSRDYFDTGAAPVLEIAGLDPGYRPVALSGQVDPDRILLHLDSSDPARLAAVLAQAEALLARHGPDLALEIVVNSYGLDLLRADPNPYRERIGRLVDRHANLAFVACGQTITRLKREGQRVELVPEARTAPSAIHEILSRMQSGWVYVKV